jgi:hypothetical protein
LLAKTLERTDGDPTKATFKLVVADIPPIDPMIPATVGDCINNLRSALEYVAHETVALDHGSVYTDNTGFPIVDDATHLWNGRSRKGSSCTVDRKHLALFSPKHRAIVRRNQPYRTMSRSQIERWVNCAETLYKDPLIALRDLSNKDKHRLLLTPYIASDSRPMNIRYAQARKDPFSKESEEFARSVGDLFSAVPAKDCEIAEHIMLGMPTLEKGAVVLSVPVEVTGPDPQMDMNAQMPPIIVKVGEYGDVTTVMELIGARVIQIVREFEPSF